MDGEIDTIAKGTKQPATRTQLLEFFDKKGYPTSVIKAVTKANKLTAQLLTELMGACSRILQHPTSKEFVSGNWASLGKIFKDALNYVLPEVEPTDRTHVQPLWLECLWKSRESTTSSKEKEAEQEPLDQDDSNLLENEVIHVDEQSHAELRSKDDDIDRAQQQEIESLQKKLFDETAKATSEQRAKKDKSFSNERDRLLKAIANAGKSPQQKESGTWRNVQVFESKRTDDDDEAEGSLQGGSTKKPRLFEENRRGKEQHDEDALRSKERHQGRDSRVHEAGNLGRPSNHDSLSRMTQGLDKWGLLTLVSSFRIAEAMQHRSGGESHTTTGVNEVEDALLQDQGGRAMTVVSEVIRLLIGPFPTKMLDLFRKNPRSFWPLAAFARTNLENMGTNEGFMVQLQVANGVTNTKSTVGKLEEKWETINDLIEPLRRLTNLTLTLDPIYGQCLQGLLGMATRELTYYKADRSPVRPFEVERMKAYVEIVRSRFGGPLQTAAHTTKFFCYDPTIMEEAKSAIFDQRTKVERKEGEKAETSDVEKATPVKKNPKNYCPKFNTETGCETTKCPQVHRCLVCGEQGHARKNCPQQRKK